MRTSDTTGSTSSTTFLRKAAVRHFGDLARHDLIHLTLEEPADPQPYPGPPEVRNLATRLGYCRLQVTRDGQAVREERLRIVELLGPVLAEELSKLEPGEAQWGFVLRRRRLLALVLADNLVENIAGRLTSLERPVPEVKGSVEVRPGRATAPAVHADADGERRRGSRPAGGSRARPGQPGQA